MVRFRGSRSGRRRWLTSITAGVLAVVLAVPAVAVEPPPADGPETLVAREVRTVYTSEFGASRPDGVAYSPDAGLLVADTGGSETSVLRLGVGEELLGTLQIRGTEGLGGATLTIDPDSGELVGLAGEELLEVAAGTLDRRQATAERSELDGVEVEDPAGATHDADGRLLVLDAANGQLVPIEADGSPSEAVALDTGNDGALRGLARNPEDGLLYVLSLEDEKLYAFDDDGSLQRIYDLSDTSLLDPQAMVFAPSSDTSDDPGTMNLFVADAGSTSLLGGVTEFTLQQVEVMAVETVTAQLVQTIDTSKWVPASPDPSGVTYLPATDRLTVVDSEVNETTGAGYHGVNVWEVTRLGQVIRGWNTLSFTNEPTGVGHDPATNTLFISTDSGTNGIHMVRAGADGQFGTSDDQRSFLNTAVLGATDTEDPEFDPATGHLFFLNGASTQVYRVNPVDGIFGNGNDIVTQFDVGQYGAVDVEGLALDQTSGTLLVGDRRGRQIYEVTKSGALVRIIDVRVPGMTFLSGMSTAPASNGSGRNNIWIVDRAVDNGADPKENDGKLFEFTLGTVGNRAPVISSVVIDQAQPQTNDTLTTSVNAIDPDGDTISYSYQWYKNGQALPGRTSSTLNLAATGNGDKGDQLAVRVIASDGSLQSIPVTSTAVTVVNSPPTFNQNLPNRSNAEGASVSFSAGATDPDADPLTYSATGLPPGVSIGASTGTIAGTIAAGAAANSPYQVSVTASDGAGSGGPSTPPPISLVQSKATDANAGTASSISLSFDQPPTAGNLLVAFGHYAANRTPSIPAGWSLALESNTGGETVIFYRIAGAGESSEVTLGYSGASVFTSLSIFEYAGMHDVQSEVLDRAVHNLGSGVSSVSTGTTLFTRHDNELLLASVGLNGTRTFDNTWTNGFVRRTNERRQTVAQRVVSSTGQFESTESWSGGTVTTAVGSMVTFRGAAAGDAPAPGTATQSFTWTVTGPATPAPPVIGSVSVSPSQPRTNDTLTASVSATGEGTLAYSYQWLKNGQTLAGATSSTLDLSVAGNGDKGDQLAVRVVASNAGGSSAPVTSSAVTVLNTPPTFDQDLPNRTDAEGATVSFSAGASDADGDTLTYGASGLPPGVSINTSTGTISGTIAAGAATNSPYQVAVTVRDGPTVAATDTFTWTVTAPTAGPGTPSGLAGASTSVSVDLNWSPGSGATPAGYRVYRSTSAQGTYTELTTTPLTSTSYRDTSAPTGATSYYRVVAVDAAGNASQPATTSVRRSAISYRSSQSATARNVTSLNLGRPAGTANGDVLIASLTVWGTPNVTPPAGWSLVRADANGSSMRQLTFVKAAGGNEPASYAWGMSALTSVSAVVSAYRGVDVVAPVDRANGQANASSTSITAPSVSVAAADSLVAGFFGVATNASITAPTGMIGQVQAVQSGGSQKLTVAATDQIVADGATGTRVATSSRAAVNVGHLVVLRPSGTAPSDPGDTQPPSAPADLESTNVTATQVDLRWGASTDDVGVVRYEVRRDGQPVGDTTLTRYTDSGLAPDTSYAYAVVAVDAAGNRSAPSQSITVRTSAAEAASVMFAGASSAATTGTTLTVARPTDVVAGDVMLASIDHAAGANLVPPAGWTHVATDTVGSGLARSVYWRSVIAAEPGSHVWTFSSATTATGVLVGYRGVHTGDPIVATGGQTNGSSTAIIAPSVTVQAPGTMVVGFFGIAANASIAGPAGMQERAQLGTGGQTKIRSQVVDQLLTEIGPTGQRQATASRAGANIGRLVALRPEGG